MNSDRDVDIGPGNTGKIALIVFFGGATTSRCLFQIRLVVCVLPYVKSVETVASR